MQPVFEPNEFWNELRKAFQVLEHVPELFRNSFETRGCTQPQCARRDATRRSSMICKKVAEELRKSFPVSSNRLVHIAFLLYVYIYIHVQNTPKIQKHISTNADISKQSPQTGFSLFIIYQNSITYILYILSCIQTVFEPEKASKSSNMFRNSFETVAQLRAARNQSARDDATRFNALRKGC